MELQQLTLRRPLLKQPSLSPQRHQGLRTCKLLWTSTKRRRQMQPRQQLILKFRMRLLSKLRRLMMQPCKTSAMRRRMPKINLTLALMLLNRSRLMPMQQLAWWTRELSLTIIAYLRQMRPRIQSLTLHRLKLS